MYQLRVNMEVTVFYYRGGCKTVTRKVSQLSLHANRRLRFVNQPADRWNRLTYSWTRRRCSPLLFFVPFFFAICSSCSIFFSRNSCFFVSISSVSRSFWIASCGLGPFPPFPPPNILPSNAITGALQYSNYLNKKLKEISGIPEKNSLATSLLGYTDTWYLDVLDFLDEAQWRRLAPPPMKGRRCFVGLGLHLVDIWSTKAMTALWPGVLSNLDLACYFIRIILMTLKDLRMCRTYQPDWWHHSSSKSIFWPSDLHQSHVLIWDPGCKFTFTFGCVHHSLKYIRHLNF